MMPIGPLMIEHRLIERMVKLLKKEWYNIVEKGLLDVEFLDKATDFMSTYADRCHHGKEEDILFGSLDLKNLDPEFRNMMNQLLKEHVVARDTLGGIIDARNRYVRGDEASLTEITEGMRKLTELYPVHIAREDRQFFMRAMEYFSKEEQTCMLQKMWEFDRNMFHEKYKAVVMTLEKAD